MKVCLCHYTHFLQVVLSNALCCVVDKEANHDHHVQVDAGPDHSVADGGLMGDLGGLARHDVGCT